MNYFALVTNDIVENVIVVSDEDCDNLQFPESEPVGQAFIASLGLSGEWLQTSETGEYRGCYAGIEYTWNGTDFVPPVAPPPLPPPPDETPTT
jgi:hypothetical protein